MGREIEQTKRHISADLQTTFSYLIENGSIVTPLCHSHFDGLGGCKVFVLRFELNHRLVKVNVTDNAVLDVSELNIEGYINQPICDL